MKSSIQPDNTANIPMKTIGPLCLAGPEVFGEIMVPLATFESPLWPSTHRGARVTKAAGGIQAIVIDECMTRSIALETTSAHAAKQLIDWINQNRSIIEECISSTSRFATLKDVHTQIVGKLIYVRVSIYPGDASGHNMATKAAEALMNELLTTHPNLRYISISGNFCTDKKVSAVNGILGRGKYVVAEVEIEHALLKKYLRTTANKIVELNIKKNHIGTNLAGTLRTANAHFANMLLAFYLATGQDAANIIEGSQGITHTEVTERGLYFSVTLPNIIVGTVGNGKTLPFVQDNLTLLGCNDSSQPPGHNARRLAIIAAATVLCGELSLLAAQTNPGELMKSHIQLERIEGDSSR